MVVTVAIVVMSAIDVVVAIIMMVGTVTTVVMIAMVVPVDNIIVRRRSATPPPSLPTIYEQSVVGGALDRDSSGHVGIGPEDGKIVRAQRIWRYCHRILTDGVELAGRAITASNRLSTTQIQLQTVVGAFRT